ncbi:E3 ubiquitin-protein ligase UBR1 [Thelohanellus kitauei]|uniref:E3 ubiquitin-protein ligase n=1 Tax=Thelohanellus kitauei TaxID=669202 RepID=A0A0C2N776_THEKT|nr:E3 ubiquitin-protein ligase UBR1 [Thelohanellus kitauei]
MEEIKRRIESIIIDGLLVTSNDSEKDIRLIYSKTRLYTLVGSPLEDYIFEGSGPDIKQWFESDEGNLGMCTKILTFEDHMYKCLECRGHDSCRLCEDCLKNPEHVNHEYEDHIAYCTDWTCDCGNVDVWKCHATCSKHMKVDQSRGVVIEPFITKITIIFQYLCELLGEICTDDHSVLDRRMENILGNHLSTKDRNYEQNINEDQNIINTDTERYANTAITCFLIPHDGGNGLNKFIDCFNHILEISNEDAEKLSKDMDEHGYTCVLSPSDVNACEKVQELTEWSKRILFNDQHVNYRITKLYCLYFMRLSSLLIDVINKFCFRKTALCGILADLVYNKTSLAHLFVFNQHKLWNRLILDINSRILSTARYSDSGRKYAALLFLKDIAPIYAHFLEDRRVEICKFLLLMNNVLYCPSVVVFMIENGFLCKMIDIYSNFLKDASIQTGADLIKLYDKDSTKLADIRRVLETQFILYSCLHLSVQSAELFANCRSQVSDSGKRLVQFCFEFDDMQPMKIYLKTCNKETNDFMLYLFGDLFMFFAEFVNLLSTYDVISTEILESFLELFLIDIQQNLVDETGVTVVQNIINYCNIYQDTFSLLNISRRVFVDIFMECCVKGTLTQNIKDMVFGNEEMLMWIARPAVTAISYVSSLFDVLWGERPRCARQLLNPYFKLNLVHYLHVQDFQIIQILMSHLDPDMFLKYLLLNISPSLRDRINLDRPIPCSLISQKQYRGYNLRNLLVLIYNALLERYIIGNYENPEYQWVERQAIHLLVLGDKTLKNIQDKIIVYRNIRPLKDNNLDKNVKQAIEQVADAKKNRREKKYSLKPEYFNFVNMFYFLYMFYDIPNFDKKFLNLYRNKKCKFQLPEVPELRNDFKGMNNFMFSKAYSDLLARVLVDWYGDSVSKSARIMDNLLVSSMSLCLMLKVSITHKISHGLQKTIELIFGIRKDLGDTSIMIFLWHLKNKVNHEVFSSVVDYLIKLCKIHPHILGDPAENPSHMKIKANQCHDLMLTIFQSELQEHLVVDVDGDKYQ